MKRWFVYTTYKDKEGVEHNILYIKLLFKFHFEYVSFGADPPQIALFYHKFLDDQKLLSGLPERV